jgi:glycosyltransferase involved in cell wall biosynthesis
MKLLYLMTEPFGVGGVQSDILALTEDLSRRGHTIYVATTPGVLLDELLGKGARHVNIGFDFRSPRQFWRAARALRRVIHPEGIDLVAPQSVRSALVSYAALRLLPLGGWMGRPGRQLPIVTTVHNIHDPRHFRYAGRLLDRCSDFVIFESHYERHRLLASGLRPDKSVVIHSGIDTDRFGPRPRDPELMRRYGLEAGRHLVFGIVARLSAEKGHRYLLEAFARVSGDIPQARLLVIGDGPLLEAVKAQARDAGLHDKVIFTGLQRDIPAHLALLDVFVLASTRESFPLAAREAMAAGCPVIAPRIGGCPEVVDDGVTGYLFEAGNVADLAARMRRIVAGQAYLAQGRAARQRVERLFSRRQWIEGDEAVYLRVARERAASPDRRPATIGALAKLVLAAATAGWVAVGSAASPLDGLLSDHQARPPQEMPRPKLHQSLIDPVFGTTITRVTDPSQIGGGVSRVRHYYAKADPFNADGSRAILFGSNGSVWLYDTVAWKPIKELAITSGDPETQWHPSDPNLLYHLDFSGNSPNVRAMFRYDIRGDRRTLLRDFTEYETVRGKLEGNMDREGRYYAMIGLRDKRLQAFVYDVANNRTSRRLDVTERMADDWISVSPSGKYVVMMGRDRSRIYDIEMNHLRDLPEGSFGHGDLCLRSDGSEVLVFDGADLQLDHNRNINIAELATGKLSSLVRIGWSSTPHVSCRNLDLPGWALISTQGPDRRYPNHDFEIFWVNLDGSREVRRVAHHHSSRRDGGYFAEQHAVSNRTGRRILFASNWGDGPIADYLIELPVRKGSGPAGNRPQ